MKRVKISRYKCGFCNKTRSAKVSMLIHEKHCFKNPDRIPYEGEITKYPMVEDPPDEAWEVPASGMIYRNGKWVDIKGYKFPNKFPEFNGLTLDKMRPLDRLLALWPEEKEAILESTPIPF